MRYFRGIAYASEANRTKTVLPLRSHAYSVATRNVVSFSRMPSLRLSAIIAAGILSLGSLLAQAPALTRSATTFTGIATFEPTVAFGNGTFVALGLKNVPIGAASNTVSAWTSLDGNTWTERVVSLPGGFANHGAVRFVNGRFIFGGTTIDGTQRPYIASSADGVAWSVAVTPSATQFVDIVSGGGTSIGFWATTLSSSTDGGVTWSDRSAPGTSSTNSYMSAAYGAGRFVLVNLNGASTSPDGITWTAIAGAQSSGRVAYGNGLFVLTGTAYRTSTDGITFTTRTPTGLTLTGTNALRFAAGRFLYHQFTFSGTTAVNQIVASADGINWSPFATYPAGASFAMHDAVEGNNRLVVVGLSASRVATVGFLDTTNLPPPAAPPTITAQPIATGGVIGGTATFSVIATGTGNTYQWRKNGAAITDSNVVGANTATLTLNNLTAASAGNYSVLITNAQGSTTSASAALTLVSASEAGRLVNLSVRTNAGTGDNTLIVGIGVGGNGTSGNKAVLLRGVGPALTAFGVGGVLADPVMTVFSGQTQVAANDDWQGGFDFAAVGAFAFGPGARDAAIYNGALASGAYSIQITGKGGATGIALAEIYDATPSTAVTATTPRLVNVSARTEVGTGDNILIGGFAVGGSTSARLLIRAVGPGLSAFNVGGVLADPKLEIYSGSTKVAENDNWAAADASVFSSVGAFNLTANSRDAVIIVALQPGTYTAQVSGVGGTTGVALVEVYQLP